MRRENRAGSESRPNILRLSERPREPGEKDELRPPFGSDEGSAPERGAARSARASKLGTHQRIPKRYPGRQAGRRPQSPRRPGESSRGPRERRRSPGLGPQARRHSSGTRPGHLEGSSGLRLGSRAGNKPERGPRRSQGPRSTKKKGAGGRALPAGRAPPRRQPSGVDGGWMSTKRSGRASLSLSPKRPFGHRTKLSQKIPKISMASTGKTHPDPFAYSPVPGPRPKEAFASVPAPRKRSSSTRVTMRSKLTISSPNFPFEFGSTRSRTRSRPRW